MFEVIGHRGAGNLLPENTLDSFKLAYSLGCPMVELDVHLTKDGQAAVIHNPFIDSVPGISGLIRDFTMEELSVCDIGGGRSIPCLTEVLLFFKDTDLFFQIELKGEDTDRVVPGMVSELGMEERVRYTSFVHARVKNAVDQGLSSGGLLMCSWPMDPVSLLEQAGAELLHLNRYMITEEYVSLLHENNKKIIAWDSIVDNNTFESLISMNVDGATTDRPDLFMDYLNSLTPVR